MLVSIESLKQPAGCCSSLHAAHLMLNDLFPILPVTRVALVENQISDLTQVLEDDIETMVKVMRDNNTPKFLVHNESYLSSPCIIRQSVKGKNRSTRQSAFFISIKGFFRGSDLMVPKLTKESLLLDLEILAQECCE
jgi:hypothetical protein